MSINIQQALRKCASLINHPPQSYVDDLPTRPLATEPLPQRQHVPNKSRVVRTSQSSKTVSFLFRVVILLALPVSILLVNNQTHYQGHAAGGVAPNMGGCQIFPSNNVWNYDISNLPLHPNSANYINYFATLPLHNYFSTPETGPTDLHYDGIPYVIVPSTQPMVPVYLTTYASISDPGPYPIPTNMPVEEPYDTSSGNDRHGEIVQSGTCKLYEIYRAYPNADGSWTAEGGDIYDLSSNQLRPAWKAAVDAAGFPIFAGLVKYDEVASGQITHALRFLLPYTQAAHLWPAIAHDGTYTDPNVPPEGLRLRLKASVDISSYPPESKVILQALKQYGMLLGDQGSSGGYVQLSGAPDSRWDLTDLASLQNIHFSDFEAVDESGLIVDPDSGQVAGVSPTPTPSPTTQVAGVSPTPTPSPTTQGANLLSNASFENTGTGWLSPWVFNVDSGAATITQDASTQTDGLYSARIDITQNATNTWGMQLHQKIGLTAGNTYTLSFFAKAASARPITIVLQQGYSPYTVYTSQTYTLSTTWQQYTLTYPATTTDANTMLAFNVGAASGQVWLDNIVLSTVNVPTATPTNTPIPTNIPTPTPTPLPLIGYPVYGDSLASGWTQYANNGSVNLANTSPVYSGSKSIAWTANPWGTFSLGNPTLFDTTPYHTLQFAAQAGGKNAKVVIQLIGSNGRGLTKYLSLANYGGQPVTGQWKVYNIPLSALNATAKRIQAIGMRNYSGNKQILYFDAISFQ